MKPEEGLEFRFQLCSAALLDDNLKLSRDFQQESLIILFQLRRPVCNVRLRQGDQMLTEFHFDSKSVMSRISHSTFSITVSNNHLLLLHFARSEDCSSIMKAISQFFQVKVGEFQPLSIFDSRTEESSSVQYFQFYGYLAQQQNMMQDYIRTSTYQRAILQNSIDFQDKVVLDVGAGSGILSFFAIQAGARKVYAVEASSIATHAETLIHSNHLSPKIQIVKGRIEEIEIPEVIDVIISEPMGYMLFNERMLETFLHAKKWLKPNGHMFPTIANLHFAPFTDESLYIEQSCKANFWHQRAFYGVDLTSLQPTALSEVFRQPIVDTFDVRLLLARPSCFTTDFRSTNETDLHNIRIPYNIVIVTTGSMHGLAFWFDVEFAGSATSIWLSTAPHEPLTHWYQVRCLFRSPIFVRAGDVVTGQINMIANSRQSYDVEIVATLGNTGIKTTAEVDLKNPYFRYSIGQPYVPPGNNKTSPTESYWSQFYGSQDDELNNMNEMSYDGTGRSVQSSGAGWNRSTSEQGSDCDMNVVGSYSEAMTQAVADPKQSEMQGIRAENSLPRFGHSPGVAPDSNRNNTYMSSDSRTDNRTKPSEMYSV